MKNKTIAKVGAFTAALTLITTYITTLMGHYQTITTHIRSAYNFVTFKKEYTLVIPSKDEALSIILNELAQITEDNLLSDVTLNTSQKMINGRALRSEGGYSLERVKSVLEINLTYSGTEDIAFIVGGYKFVASLIYPSKKPVQNQGSNEIAAMPFDDIVSRLGSAGKDKINNATTDGLLVKYKDKKALGVLKDWIETSLSTARPIEPNLYIPSWDDWRRAETGTIHRQLNHVVLDGKIKEELIEDIDSFFSSKEMYDKIGKPFHRGYLFTGPPGTGKSSFVKALAYHFGVNVYYLNLNDVKQDSSLQGLFSSVSPYSILLLEDVDSYNAALARDDDNKDLSIAEVLSIGSTSALLNALDGIHTPTGVIIIMTTNHIEKLDPAVLRPGRVDKTFEFNLATLPQLKKMWLLVSDKELPKEYEVFVGKSPAAFSEVMLSHAKNPDLKGTIDLTGIL